MRARGTHELTDGLGKYRRDGSVSASATTEMTRTAKMGTVQTVRNLDVAAKWFKSKLTVKVRP